MIEIPRRRYLQAISLASVGGIAGCVGWGSAEHPITENVTEWPSFRGDQYNTGYAKGVTDVEAEPAIEWEVETGDDIWGSPIVVDGTVYIGSADNTIYAIDASTGAVDWTFPTDHRIEGTPAFADGTIFIGSYDKRIYAIDAETGDEQWSVETDGLIRGSPTVVDGVVYIGVGCHELACAWYAQESDVPEAGWVMAFDADTGDELWTVPTEFEIVSTPAVTSEAVFIGSSDTNLYCLDTETGEKKWTYETEHYIWSSPSAAYDTVFFGDWDGYLHAVDADSGERSWKFDTGGEYISASPAVAADTVYIGTTPINRLGDATPSYGEVIAIDRTEGTEEWRYETEALEIGSSPVVTDDYLYTGTHAPSGTDGTGLLCLTLEGEEQWFIQSGGRGIGSSPVVLDGVIYFGGTDNNVYAMR